VYQKIRVVPNSLQAHIALICRIFDSIVDITRATPKDSAPPLTIKAAIPLVFSILPSRLSSASTAGSSLIS